MNIIEPCCYEKQLTEMLSKIEGTTNVAHFYSFSDWDLNVLLPFFAGRTPGGKVTLCLIQVEPVVLQTIRTLMNRKVINPATRKSIFLVEHFSLITRGDNRADIQSILAEFGDRVSICEDSIGFRCFTCANDKRQFVVQGSINQHPMTVTQMFTVTTGKELYDQAQALLNSKIKVNVVSDYLFVNS